MASREETTKKSTRSTIVEDLDSDLTDSIRMSPDAVLCVHTQRRGSARIAPRSAGAEPFEGETGAPFLRWALHSLDAPFIPWMRLSFPGYWPWLLALATGPGCWPRLLAVRGAPPSLTGMNNHDIRRPSTSIHPFSRILHGRVALPLALLLVPALVLTLGPGAVDPAASQPTEDAPRILVVVTNHGHMEMPDGTTKPTGYWLAEVTHPWEHFVDAGFTVDFASPEGGFSPMDPRSFDLEDATNRRFWEDLEAVQSLVHNHALGDLDPEVYDAVYFAGGHGTMWDFPGQEAVENAIREVWRDGGVVAAVCHGPAALVDVRLDDGTPLVAGRRVTAFSNSEEEAVGLTRVVPFLLVDRLEERGAEVVTADDWQGKVVVDGRLVTGQNPSSAAEAGARIVEMLRAGVER